MLLQAGSQETVLLVRRLGKPNLLAFRQADSGEFWHACGVSDYWHPWYKPVQIQSNSLRELFDELLLWVDSASYLELGALESSSVAQLLPPSKRETPTRVCNCARLLFAEGELPV